MMKDKIVAYLETDPVALNYLKNLEEFYFEKGRDALNDFLEMELSSYQLDELIADSEDYRSFEEKSLSNTLYQEILSKINHIVSYCDTNAKNKHVLNQYDDIRVVAKSGVRQSNWVQNLLRYSKEKNEQVASSIKNALDYLLEPQQGISVLSEAHRKMVATTILKVEYSPRNFIRELKNYFEEFHIGVKNPDNYTRIISHILYHFQEDWIEQVVGLMASDTTGWQDTAINDLVGNDATILWNSKNPTGTSTTIKFLREIIGEGSTFNLYYCNGDDISYRATIIDFATNQKELDDKQWSNDNFRIANYHSEFSAYHDDNKKAGIVFLAGTMEKLEKVKKTDFKIFGTYQYPRQDNLQPVSYIPNNITLLKPEIDQEMKDKLDLLESKKQIILQGPPGTGKTYTAKDMAEQILFDKISKDKSFQKKKLESSEQFELIQFHPSYTYEDFVRGIVAKPSDSGQIEYVAENKVFGKFANKALKNTEESVEKKPYVLIIDEINRANLPSVLGELIYALEYRNEKVETMYAINDDASIVIPENLYIIGTMNTADRSVGSIDYAIKRRFAFVDVLPKEAVINNELAKTVFKKVSKLFVVEKEGKKEKAKYLAPDFDYKEVQLGHSYFILKEGDDVEKLAELKMRFKYEILPILREYVKDGLLLETATEKIDEIASFLTSYDS